MAYRPCCRRSVIGSRSRDFSTTRRHNSYVDLVTRYSTLSEAHGGLASIPRRPVQNPKPRKLLRRDILNKPLTDSNRFYEFRSSLLGISFSGVTTY